MAASVLAPREGEEKREEERGGRPLQSQSCGSSVLVVREERTRGIGSFETGLFEMAQNTTGPESYRHQSPVSTGRYIVKAAQARRVCLHVTRFYAGSYTYNGLI